jgi:hypothetical protein
MKQIQEIADHKEAAQILDAEYSALNWNATKVHGGHRSRDNEGWEHFTWQVAFVPPYKTAQFFDWKSGIGVVWPKTNTPKAPNPAEVLARCCADYGEADHSSFADWAATFGYEEDSRKAFRVYEACQELGPKLKALGLSREQIQRFADLSSML